MTPRSRNADGTFKTIHGQKQSRLYRVWCAMKERCSNPHNKSYPRYGGRGVEVCKEWRESFQTFAEWSAHNGYQDGLTIDRIDNSKGYSEENCRWVTTAEQNRNYGRNVLLTYQGKTQGMADWAEELGINRSTISFRLRSGKTVEEALSKNDGRKTRWKKTPEK